MSDPAPRQQPVLVTGASGNAGRELVSHLRARGVPFRVAGRRPERLRASFGHEVEAVRLDFFDPGTFATAARGSSAVFLLRPPAVSRVAPTLIAFIDAARGVGVEHVVFLSVAGAERSRFVPHRKVEEHLASRPGGYTLLRPGFFAQNLQDAYRLDIIEDGRLYVPAGRGRVAFVDLRDVAEVALRALCDPASHRGRAYVLTGPEAIPFAQVAAELERTLGHPVRYQAASVPGYARHLARRGIGWSEIAVLCALHVGLRWGQAAKVDPMLEQLLGRRPRTIRDYIADHARVWRRSGAPAASGRGVPGGGSLSE